MTIDRVRQQVSIPADMGTRTAQAEALHFITAALGVFMAASGIHGLQITLERLADGELNIVIVPSDVPGDAEILRDIGAQVPGLERNVMVMH